MPHLCLRSDKQNFRLIEKKILDNIIGDSTYDSRIRPSGLNVSDGMCSACCLGVGGNHVTFGNPGRADSESIMQVVYEKERRCMLILRKERILQRALLGLMCDCVHFTFLLSLQCYYNAMCTNVR